MILSHRQIKADKQHLDSNGKNVRQWIYEEEPLINEADKDIPVTNLHVKADLVDRIKPLGVGDRVRWSALGLSRMDNDASMEDIKNMRGIIDEFIPNLDNKMVAVSWEGVNPRPGAFGKCHIDNLERALTARADLKDSLRRKQLEEEYLQETLTEPDVDDAIFKRGNRVVVNARDLDRMLGDFTHRYLGNVGTVLKSYRYEDYDEYEDDKIKCLVRWTRPVGTPTNTSTFPQDSLELA